MNFNLTAKKYSVADIKTYLESIGIGFKNFIRFVKVKSVLCIVYIGQWGIAARFVSIAELTRTKMKRMIERSREVQFIPGTNTTVSGNTVCMTTVNCTCKAFENGDHVLYIGGKAICKHLIAKAKLLGINSVSKFADFILND